MRTVIRDRAELLRPTYAALVLTAAVAAVATGAVGSRITRTAPATLSTSVLRFVPSPPGVRFDDPTVGASSDKIVVSGTAGDVLETSALFAVDLQRRTSRKLSVAAPERCGDASFQFPQRLHDGALALVRYCLGRPGSALGRSVNLVRLTNDAATVPIVPYKLPFFVGRFSIRADGRGVINDGRGLSERLLWLGRNRLRPLASSWARAGQPAWSPDGRRIAVAASTTADSPRSPEATWSLFLLDPEGRPTRKLVDGIRGPMRPAWSPNGRLLALTMTWTDGVRGIYIIDVHHGTVRLSRVGRDYGNTTWIDNSRLVAAVHPTADTSDRGKGGIEELRLSALSH